MNIKVVNKSDYDLPTYADPGSSGMDIRANIGGSICLGGKSKVIIPTGLFLEIPMGFEIQVRPRSGLAATKGITVLNSPGTIDSSYRGELKVILYNTSDEPWIINPGDRIAQIVLQEVPKVTWQEVMELSKTSRGEGGLGHTGIN